MALDPITLTEYKDAAKYLPRATGVRTFEQDVVDLTEGPGETDFFRRYVGPLPPPDDMAGLLLLEKSFAPIGTAKECLSRHVRGVIGREPSFEIVLPDLTETRKERRRRLAESKAATLTSSEKFADEVDLVQGDVWNARGEHKTAKGAVKRLRATGKVFVRYDIPPGIIDKGFTVGDWKSAYKSTYMEVCARGTASIEIDSYTLQKTALYSFTLEEGKKKIRCIQVSFLDDDGLTVVRTLRNDRRFDATQDEDVIDCGGELLVVEAEAEALMTPDVLRWQDIASSLATMIKINGDVAGFPQVDTIDVAEPGYTEPDPADPTKKRFVPATLPSGPRTIRAFNSQYVLDENGSPVLGTDNKPILLKGGVQYRDPVSSEPLRDDVAFCKEEIYSSFHQGHLIKRTAADASGELLVQLRADYADSLLETKPEVEKLLCSVLKGRLCMAASLAKAAEPLKQFKEGRVRLELQLNAGPLSQVEKVEIRAQLSEGLMKRETAMVLLREVDDVPAELRDLEQLEAQGQNVPTPRATLRQVA